MKIISFTTDTGETYRAAPVHNVCEGCAFSGGNPGECESAPECVGIIWIKEEPEE